MAVRRSAEPTFLDAAMASMGSARRAAFYARLDALVPWDQLCAPIMSLPCYGEAPKGGRPAVPPMLMLKSLMLAKWHNLSDQQLEDQLADSVSMRRFVGLNSGDPTPDATSFVRFRERLVSAGLLDTLHEAVLGHLANSGVLVCEGTIVDATFIEAPKGGKSADGTPTRDPQASYAAKAGRPHFGYKAHAAADRSGIITDVRVTHANVHDAAMVDEMTRDEVVAVYADSAYHKIERRTALRSRGVLDGIMYQRRRGQAELTPSQAAWNAMVRPVRVTIEHAFGRLKRMVGDRTRWRGLRATTTHLQLSVIALNLRHGLHLQR